MSLIAVRVFSPSLLFFTLTVDLCLWTALIPASMGSTLAETSQRWQARTRLGQGRGSYAFESWLEMYF